MAIVRGRPSGLPAVPDRSCTPTYSWHLFECVAEDIDESRRCVALAISRMADGVQLLVERALDHLETKGMATDAKG
ncbi:hypothetical protein [Pseudomonas sp. SWRI154]|uniref:DUF6124 family protein n=1 Tax=Pseudomonas sp. SWRI154 TaxID=2745501 RepID=UPI001EE20E53|nr:hypothetical protein [Pseudomonas sp. SWRI154]